jgi:acyl carrier protein
MAEVQHNNEKDIIMKALRKYSTATDMITITGDMLIGESLGITSLDFVKLILDIEAELGRNIFDIDTIGEIERVEDIFSLL